MLGREKTAAHTRLVSRRRGRDVATHPRESRPKRYPAYVKNNLSLQLRYFVSNAYVLQHHCEHAVCSTTYFIMQMIQS